MEPIASTWRTRHGDSSHSPRWAVVAEDGSPIDLTSWAVRAQLRDDIDSTSPVFTFTKTQGVTIGSAKVSVSSGRRITTSTIQLYLLPSYYDNIPRPFEGIIDVEVSSDNTAAPLQRYTIVQVAVDISKDVTR